MLGEDLVLVQTQAASTTGARTV